jgi:hypothetical protein
MKMKYVECKGRNVRILFVATLVFWFRLQYLIFLFAAVLISPYFYFNLKYAGGSVYFSVHHCDSVIIFCGVDEWNWNFKEFMKMKTEEFYIYSRTRL